ncbi:hypothetical protein [Pelosinus sp. UFO1]|uniref:hypothetical protein n=1 Tax=Pelosinus sp. UFO1 TaxID=484770 RepID=UPI0004D102E5|nr:hypothetical protein [Pelosinus sp. UFO1]AIF53267.1 hypothetical protein UFO1_3724 [Pelosinus sp. UFO1]
MILFKKICILFALLQFSAVLIPLPAFAFKTYHVAVLPLINSAHCSDQEVLQLVQTKINDKFKYPFYEIIPLAPLSTDMQKNISEKTRDKANMTQLADALSADIVIAVELVRAESVIVHPSIWNFSSNNDDTYVDTNVLLTCYTYSAADDRYLSFKASTYGVEPMTADTDLYHSVEKTMDQLTSKLPYKRVPQGAVTSSNNNLSEKQ